MARKGRAPDPAQPPPQPVIVVSRPRPDTTPSFEDVVAWLRAHPDTRVFGFPVLIKDDR